MTGTMASFRAVAGSQVPAQRLRTALRSCSCSCADARQMRWPMVQGRNDADTGKVPRCAAQSRVPRGHNRLRALLLGL